MHLREANFAQIVEVSDRNRDAATALLTRFFREEGFSTAPDRIAENLDAMLADKACWCAMTVVADQPTGVVTVTTMLYIEWGRLGEIGDLYVLPDYRRQGIARSLVDAAVDWSRRRGCSGLYVTITPDGETRGRLSQFYRRLDFKPTGRTTMLRAAAGERPVA